MDLLVPWLNGKLCLHKLISKLTVSRQQCVWGICLYLSLDMSTVLTSMNDSGRFRNINSVWNFMGVFYCLCIHILKRRPWFPSVQPERCVWGLEVCSCGVFSFRHGLHEMCPNKLWFIRWTWLWMLQHWVLVSVASHLWNIFANKIIAGGCDFQTGLASVLGEVHLGYLKLYIVTVIFGVSNQDWQSPATSLGILI